MNADEAIELLTRNNGRCVIDIYCDDESHTGGVYPGREAMSFALDARDDPVRWIMYAESKLWKCGKGTRTRKPPRDSRSIVFDNRRVNDDIGDVDPSILEIPGVHVRHRLYCKECTKKRKYATTPPQRQIIDETVVAARLHPVLDAIALNAEHDAVVECVNPGVFRIRLFDLAAKVRSG